VTPISSFDQLFPPPHDFFGSTRLGRAGFFSQSTRTVPVYPVIMTERYNEELEKPPVAGKKNWL
jgi:hypothetical protein